MTQEDYGTAVDWLEKAKGDGLELAWAKYLAEESETALKDAQQHVETLPREQTRDAGEATTKTTARCPSNRTKQQNRLNPCVVP